MHSSILYDRFTTLPNIRGHFHRPRIDKLLSKALEFHLIIVTAGAGCGKTQAVSYFMHNSDTDFIWLQLSKLDNYSVRFWENFIHAVSLHNPELFARLSAFGFPATPALFHNFLHTFVDFTADTNELVLIFDDIHLIHESSVLNFIENLIYARLKNLSVVLIGRSISDLDIQDLSANGDIYFLTEDELSFTKKEAENYFNEQGLILSEDSFEEIYAETLGWISALYLISISLTKNDGKSLNAVTMAKQQIFELLEQKIFSIYSEEVRCSLTGWALFERIPEDFLKKHSKNALNIINEVVKTNLFVRFNPITKTYDIHHLFLEFLLEKQYEYLTDEEIKEEHLKAADWYHKNGSEIEALTHYQKCGNYEKIWDIIRHSDIYLPINISNWFLELIESMPEQLLAKDPLIPVVHANLLLYTGRIQECAQEFQSIINKYESPPQTAGNLAVAGEAYLFMAIVSMVCFDHKFVEYYKKADKYLPGGSVLISDTLAFTRANFMMMVNNPAPGEFKKHINAIMEGMPYGSRAMNGAGYGIEYVTKAEGSYYICDMKDAEDCCYTAITKAKQSGHIATISTAYSILNRIYTGSGNYAKARKCVEELDEEAQNPKHYTHTEYYIAARDIMMGWYYTRIGDYKKVPGWIIKDENRGLTPNALDRENFIRAYYLLENEKYYELSALLDRLDAYYNITGVLLARIEVQIYKAILANKTDSISLCVKALRNAYDLSVGNGILMSFIELGKYMRAVIYNVRNSGENTIPEKWLADIYTKSATYEKHLNNIKKQYQQEYKSASTAAVKLTKREIEMLKYLCQGLTNTEIADTCYITVSAVKKSLNNIYTKLGALNRADAVRIAIQLDLNK